MTSATVGTSRRGSSGRGAAPSRGLAGALHAWLERPLSSYSLLLGSAGLLVALGLVMVLSASSVTSYASSGSSFTIAEKQAMWVALGLPARWIGMRLPVRVYRLVGYPLLLGALGLLVLVLVPHVGVRVAG